MHGMCGTTTRGGATMDHTFLHFTGLKILQGMRCKRAHVLLKKALIMHEGMNRSKAQNESTKIVGVSEQMPCILIWSLSVVRQSYFNPPRCCA